MSQLSTQKAKGAPTSCTHKEEKSSPGDDWRDTKTAEQCLAHLCLSEHLSDVTFTFSGDQSVKLPAHKFIMSMRSAVFEAMFNGPLAEGDTVQIEDVEPETMKVMLRFVYTDKPDLNGDTVLSCLYAAKKYGLIGLVTHCSEFLERNIDKGNVCSIHEHAVFYEVEPLRKQCFDYILDNATYVFATTGFLKISHETLIKLFKDDALSAEEIDIFNAAVRWAQDKCNAEQLPKMAENERKILDKALFEIRFPIMQVAEFAKIVTPTGILTSDEQVMLYQLNATKGSSPLTKFNREVRSGGTITVDFTKHIDAHYNGDSKGFKGYQQVFYLQISNSIYEEDYEIEEEEYREVDAHQYQMSFDRRSLKITSIKGIFVKNVKHITSETNPVVNYEIVGNKILFQPPIAIGHGNTIQFHPTNNHRSTYHKRSRHCASSRANIQKNVNGQTVNFVSVPVGLETITFKKQ